MTSYHGGKQRIGKKIAHKIYDIATDIEKETGVAFKGYCEPFCGMCGVYQHIPELFEDHKPKLKYKAGDANKSVILMWQEVQKGWIPPTSCSREKFEQLKGNGESSAEKGFLGHACSFRGKYFANYYPERSMKITNKVEDMSSKLSLVKFTDGDYDQFSKIRGYIVYCDPPYKTNSYYYTENHKYKHFDHDKFYQWVEKMACNNLVFISERVDLPYKLIEKYHDGEKLYLV